MKRADDRTDASTDRALPEPGLQHQALDLAPDPCWIFSPGGRLLYLNQAARSLNSGRLPQDPQASAWEAVMPSALALALRAVSAADQLSTDQPSTDQMEDAQLCDIGGQPHTLRVARLQTGSVSVYAHQALSLGADNQSRVLALAESNVRLSAFNYTVAHDLSAPIRHISGLIGLLKRDLRQDAARSFRLDPEDRQRFGASIETIETAAERAADLVRDLLNFASGREMQQQADIDLNAMIAEELETLAPSHAGRQVQVTVHPLPTVRADPGLLSVVLSNLLSNALKYTMYCEHTRIEIGSQTTEREVIVWVRDNGSGFDARYARKLFTPLGRLHGSRYPGHGIGLATVRQIISRHGGRVWATGVPEQGATFSFSLPKS